MRILQVMRTLSSSSGGPPRSMLATSRALHEEDRDLLITVAATTRHLDPSWRQGFVQRMPSRMELQIFSSVGRHAFILSVPMLRWLLERIHDFDLVVIRGIFHPIGAAAAMIARRQGVPYVLTPLGSLSRYTFSHRRTVLKRVYFRLVIRRLLAGAAAIRFTSSTERAEAPIEGSNVRTRVIPHPYESRFDLASKKIRNPRQILFLSRFHPVKGMDLLLRAFAKVQQALADCRLVLAGSGTERYERRVAREIQRLGLNEAVERPGFVEGDQKRRLLTESTVFVLLSRHESFGLAVVEAMDAALPVLISSGVHIWPEVEKENAGIVVEERKVGAVADALIMLLTNKSLRSEMGQNGQNLVRTAYNPREVGRELSQFYQVAAKRQACDQ